MRDILERCEEMLTSLEWVWGGEFSADHCQICNARKGQHEPRCLLAALLADLKTALDSSGTI